MTNCSNNEQFDYEDLGFDFHPQVVDNNVEFDDSETQDMGALYGEQVVANEGTNPGANVSGTTEPRGPNIIHWGANGKEKIKWSNSGVPLFPRKKCAEFSNFIGSLAADGGFYPINVTDWRHFKGDNHKRAWDRVKGTINWFDQHTASKKSVIKNYTFKKMADRWKHHKSHLKRKYWAPKQGTPERFQCNDELVDETQWKKFVDYLDKEDTQSKAVINVSNRAKRTIHHSTGTRTFAAVVYEWQLENQVEEEPDRWEIFKLTHIKKGAKDQYVDAASTKAVMEYELAEEERKKLNIEITPQVREDIYAEVLGVEKRNVVRGLGPVVKWQDVPYIHTEKRVRSVEGLQARLDEQRLEIEREKVEAANREEKVRADLMEREKTMREEMEQHRREQKALMDENLKLAEERAFQKMAHLLKEAGITSIDMSQGALTQPQSSIPVIPTPSMQYGYHPEIPGAVTS